MLCPFFICLSFGVVSLCFSDGFLRGVIVPGGFGKRGMEGKIAAVKWCRTTRKPFLGVCLGMQAAVIEFTRLLNIRFAKVDEES